MALHSSGLSSTYRIVWAPKRQSPPIHVLLPSSFASDAAHLREKTLRIGQLCRALAIFRVEKAIIYHEDPKNPDPSAKLIKTIFDYMNTAPYLRKRLYPVTPELRFAGLLPPLNIPSHPSSDGPPVENFELRQGLVVKKGTAYFVEAGTQKPIKLKNPRRPGSKVLLLSGKIKGRLKFKLVSKSKLEFFTGITTEIHQGDLKEVLKPYSYKIATSRKGIPIVDAVERLKTGISTVKSPICIAFGSYKKGLYEIAEDQGYSLDNLFSVVVNFIPDQGVRTVRTEEAVYASLSVINYLLSSLRD
jgi:predicted SPOUT superfamily RNA methylase MTH1